MKINPKTIVQSAEIPSIPHILQQILSLADSPRTSSSDLEKYVTQEPALVAQLLKWVNSAAYAVPQRVSSVSHAMIMLGFSTVKSIASGMILVNTFDDLSGLEKQFVNFVWHHTLTSAAIMKVVANRESNNKRDDYFLAAMIHDVGYLVLKQYFQEKYNQLLAIDPYPHIEDEREILGTDHVEVGVELLTEWKFSQVVIDMVKFHHEPEKYPHDKKDVYYLRICDELSVFEGLNEFLSLPEDQVNEEFLADLSKAGLNWLKLKDMKAEILLSIEMVQKLFK